MLGSYAEWLNWNPNILQSVIPMLLRALQNTEVVTPASLALKDITRETHDHIHPFADQILTACWVSKHVYLYRRSMDANARTVGITYLWYPGI